MLPKQKPFIFTQPLSAKPSLHEAIASFALAAKLSIDTFTLKTFESLLSSHLEAVKACQKQVSMEGVKTYYHQTFSASVQKMIDKAVNHFISDTKENLNFIAQILMKRLYSLIHQSKHLKKISFISQNPLPKKKTTFIK